LNDIFLLSDFAIHAFALNEAENDFGAGDSSKVAGINLFWAQIVAIIVTTAVLPNTHK